MKIKKNDSSFNAKALAHLVNGGRITQCNHINNYEYDYRQECEDPVLLEKFEKEDLECEEALREILINRFYRELYPNEL
jgi:hypothetical protein